MTCVPAPGSVFPIGVTSVTCTASDASGNQATTTFTVTVQDTTAPALADLPDLSGEQASAAGTAITFATPTATDAADPAPSVVCVPASGTVFPLGVTTVTCTATDAAGNQSSSSFSVTIEDTTPPSLSPTSDQTVEATSPNGATVTFPAPTASDVCDASPSVVCAPASGTVFPLGVTTVTCTASDASGNQAVSTFTVSVADTTAPSLGQPADVVVEQANAAGTPVVFATPAVSDAVDPNPSVACAPASGTVFPLGVTSVTCTVSDASGNQASATFTVTVRDTTPPTLTQPADLELPAAGPSGAVATFVSPQATDFCDASPSVICAPPSGSTFPLGVTTVTCTASDASGNQAVSTFTVSVTDATPPTITPPADSTHEQATAAGAVVTYPAPSVGDAVDPNPSVVCTPPAGSTFPLGVTTVTCTASDASGNQATATFAVTVVDTTPPVLAQPANLSAEAMSAAGAALNYATPGVSDVCDASPSVACAPPSGSTFPLGVSTVTCTASDVSGNQAATTFTVTVIDTTPPTISTQADLSAEQSSPAGALVSFPTPSASDLVGGPLPVTCSPASGTVFPLGVTTVTCTASDASGNQATTTFTVTVLDTTPPTITAPGDQVVEQSSLGGAALSFAEPSATDVCDVTPAVTCSPAPGTVFPLGVTTVTCTATDTSGNQAATTFTITVQDTTPPVLTCPPDVQIASPDGNPVPASDPQVVAWLTQASASDVCDASPTISHDATSFPVGVPTTVTFVATDASGNSVTCERTVTAEAVRIKITYPAEGACLPAPATVAWITSGSPTNVVLTGTRTRYGVANNAGPGPHYSAEGDYHLTATATLGPATASDEVRFSIDCTKPTLTISSPVHTPYPSQSYPLTKYRYSSDLPIPLTYDARDDDGTTGGVERVEVRLDGVMLPVSTPSLTEAVFVNAGLPVLGSHTLEIKAYDCAGNICRKIVCFEIVLYDQGGGLLVVKPESLNTNGGIMTAFFTLPQSATGSPLGPNYADVVHSTLRLTALGSGQTAAPERVQVSAGNGKLILKFRRSQLAAPDGTIGTKFRLTGRFFTTSGPAFAAEDEIKKAKK